MRLRKKTAMITRQKHSEGELLQVLLDEVPRPDAIDAAVDLVGGSLVLHDDGVPPQPERDGEAQPNRSGPKK